MGMTYLGAMPRPPDSAPIWNGIFVAAAIADAFEVEELSLTVENDAGQR